jgi:hypothetical protein
MGRTYRGAYRGADHRCHGVKGGQPADQQQRRIAEPVRPPARSAVQLHQLEPRDQHHHQRDEEGPQRRGLREHELQDESHGGELDGHAHGGDGEARFEPQPKGQRDRAVDDQQQRRQHQIEGGKLDIAHAAALSDLRAAIGQQQPRARARSGWPRLTRMTMRSASIWNLISLDERGRLGIEGGGRLIEQQHARLVGDGADEPQARRSPVGSWAIGRSMAGPAPARRAADEESARARRPTAGSADT